MKKLISFDFDGTLEDEFGGFINIQKEEIQSLAKKYISEGHEVIIITKRYDSNHSTLGLNNEYIKVFEVARRLGIERVYFTNREWKYKYLIDLGVDIHFENSEHEIFLINEAYQNLEKKCLVIPVEEHYWKDLLK